MRAETRLQKGRNLQQEFVYWQSFYTTTILNHCLLIEFLPPLPLLGPYALKSCTSALWIYLSLWVVIQLGSQAVLVAQSSHQFHLGAQPSSSERRLSLAPTIEELGDVITVLHKAIVLILLRPLGDDRYSVVELCCCGGALSTEI
jgi:hypothetical protein